MNERAYALFGVIGPLIAYIFIGISIASAPWFSWWKNALSDLGHSSRRDVASYFNLGLAAAGFLVTIYAVTVFKKHAKYTTPCLAISAFLLQLVAVFDEVYGSLHRTLSMLFFASIAVTTITYAIEKKSLLAVVAFIVGLGSWMLREAEICLLAPRCQR